MQFEIRARTLTVALTAMAMVLAAAHAAFFVLRFGFDYDYVFGLAKLFDFWDENNFPAYFSALLLMAAGLLLGVLGAALRKQRAAWAWHWVGIAAVFAFLSIDEALALHERLITPVRTALGTSGILYSAWIIPYGIAFLLLALAYLRFFLALPTATRWRFTLAAVLFLTGAVVLEALSGVEWERTHVRTLLLDAYVFFEDLFEMAGVIVFIRAILLELGHHSVSIRFAGH